MNTDPMNWIVGSLIFVAGTVGLILGNSNDALILLGLSWIILRETL